MKLKFKFLITTLCFVASTFTPIEAEQKAFVIARLIITDAKIHGKDMTYEYTSNDGYLLLYSKGGSEEIYFARILPKIISQSSGIISNYTTSKQSASEDTYEVDIYTFDWKFTNSFDKEIVDSKVNLAIIHTPRQLNFVCTIKSVTGINAFKGYLVNPK